MNRLNTDHINDRAPYFVAYDEDGAIVFSPIMVLSILLRSMMMQIHTILLIGSICRT